MGETVIRLNDGRYWLVAAVDPVTSDFLHVKLHPACTIALTERFLRELRAKHDVEDALFLVDGAPWLQAALHRYGYRFRHETHGNRNAVERVFEEIKRRTNQFTNHFRHPSAESAESWLQTLAFAWNQLIRTMPLKTTYTRFHDNEIGAIPLVLVSARRDRHTNRGG